MLVRVKSRLDPFPDLLEEHLKKVKKQHLDDLASGYGSVYLPNALAKKYPSAEKSWQWQYVFPSSKLTPPYIVAVYDTNPNYF